MFRECGATAYGITLVAFMATLLSIAALIAAAQRTRGGVAISVCALGFGMLVMLAGAGGTALGRHEVDRALGPIDGNSGPMIDPARASELRIVGYAEAFQCTRLGAMSSVLPLALGATALLLALRRRNQTSTSAV